MVYAEILAGGNSTRMNDSTLLPKQFIEINNKPTIIYTIEKFLNNKLTDKIIIGCQDSWKTHLEKIIKKFIDKSSSEMIFIYPSGKDRNVTIINGCKFIQETFGLNDDDIIITMDATRIMVTDEIITNNILAVKEHPAVSTVFPVVDTIGISNNNGYLDSIPVRSNMYSIQTPETFNIKKLMEYYYKTSKEDLNTITSIAKLFLLNNEKVYMVNR